MAALAWTDSAYCAGFAQGCCQSVQTTAGLARSSGKDPSQMEREIFIRSLLGRAAVMSAGMGRGGGVSRRRCFRLGESRGVSLVVAWGGF